MRRLWDRLVGFFKGVVLISVVFACIPSLQKECGAQKAPVLQLSRPDSIVQYSPPAIYAIWWQEIADCEGLDAHANLYHFVQFFEVRGTEFYPQGMSSVLGATFAKDAQIFIASPYIWDESLIKHEMLHALLWLNGFNFGPWHPAEFFMQCGVHPWGP